MKLLKLAAALLGVAVVVVAGLIGSGLAAEWIDRYVNRVYEPDDGVEVTAAAQTLHRSLFIADLHADTMLWSRDLLRRADYGHVDLPRLVDGNVGLQVFAVVTKTPQLGDAPADAELVNPDADSCIAHDNLNFAGWLQVAQLRPLETWFDLKARAFHQIDRLKNFIAQSAARHAADPDAPYLTLIRSADDLAELIAARKAGEPVIGALLAVEGAHWIGGAGQPVEAGVAELFNAGVRMLAPTHRFNNALGGASEGCNQRAGLSDEGRAFLAAAEARGIVLDLAHASDTGIAEAAEGRAGPIVISHTGARRICETAQTPGDCVYERNMRDAEIQAVARTGGAVAIGYWPEAVGRGLQRVARGFRAAYAALSDPGFVEEMRVRDPGYDPLNHIALGSDFDGAVDTPFDVGDLARLTAVLSGPASKEDGAAAFGSEALRRIYGANACRILALRLPGGGAEAVERACAPLVPAGSGGSNLAGGAGTQAALQ